MSRLKDYYIKIGADIERLENDPWYLAELTLEGATEINNYLIGKKTNFEHIKEFTEILEKYQLRNNDIHSPEFPYMALYWATKKDDSSKKIKKVTEIALEMGLLRLELKNLPTENKKLEDLIKNLCNLSTAFISEGKNLFTKYLAA